jgi:hypothetical protein
VTATVKTRRVRVANGTAAPGDLVVALEAFVTCAVPDGPFPVAAGVALVRLPPGRPSLQPVLRRGRVSLAEIRVILGGRQPPLADAR